MSTKSPNGKLTIPLEIRAPINFAASIDPFTSEELKAFHTAVAKIKKIPDYVQHTSVSKLTSDDWTAFEDSKKCCGNEWVAIVEPTSIYQNHGQSDVKPVVEHIEDDLKYDFRTKTHSF